MSKENWCSCHDSLVCGNCSAKKDKRISELEAQLAEANGRLDAIYLDIADKDEQVEALRKHYSERLYRFSLNHERYNFIRDCENWSVDVDGINDWEILTELSLDEFDNHIDVCMKKAGWNYPIAPTDDKEALQSSKASVDEIKHIQERVCNVISSVRWGWDGDCGCEREVDNWFDRYLSEQKASVEILTRQQSETKAQAVEEALQKIRYYIKHNDFESREDDLAQGQLIACENISKILEQLRDSKQ